MTNGEKLQEIIPNLEYKILSHTVLLDNGAWFSLDWWNAEYKDSPTKNNLEVDCISREQAKVAIRDKFKDIPSRVEINTILNELPSVIPQPCEDAVSRQAVLELIADYDLSMGQVVRGIHALPSVTPQEPKTGYWISTETKGVRYAFWCRYKCSLCGGLSDRTNFCPNCGAKMAESEK